MLTSVNELLLNALAGRYAVPSFCVWDAVTARAVLQIAERKSGPVILMCGPVELALLSPREMAAVILPLIEASPAAAALHLDHGDSLELVYSCIDAGFNSVMLDYSHRPFRENASALKEVSKIASAKSITVEGELGAVGKIDGEWSESSEGAEKRLLTDPKQAAKFVQLTEIHALAIAIGNAHGNYREDPKLDFARLEEIKRRVGIPLVLHGGSGTPQKDLDRAIELGIAKVNVASELVRALRASLMDQWSRHENEWIPTALKQALEKLQEVVGAWFDKTGSTGKSSAGR